MTTLPDCRCAICHCCQYDHGGWRHDFVSKTDWEEQARKDMERLKDEDLSDEPEAW